MNDALKDFQFGLSDKARKGAGAFEPKLTFEQRCQILAADKAGVKRTIIAAAFGVARPTVAYICNPSSKYYRNVRKEWHTLGEVAFYRQYLTPALQQKLNEAAETIDAKATDDQHKELRRFEGTVNGPNKAYKQKAGEHKFWHPHDNIVYVCEILWLDELPAHVFDEGEQFTGPGWYAIETAAEYEQRGYPTPGENATHYLMPDWGNPGPKLTSSDMYKTYMAAYGLEKIDE